MPIRSPDPRKEPRQGRARSTVTAILDATARILANDGYDAVTTNRVAEIAGVSVGSLYQYFPDKSALVGAVAVRHTEAMAEGLAEAARAATEDDLPTLAARLIRATLTAHELNPRLRLAIIEELPRIGRPKRIVELKRGILQSVETLLRARNHELRLEDVPLTAFVVVNTIEQVSHAAQLAKRYDPKALERELVRLVLNYLTGAPRPLDRRASDTHSQPEFANEPAREANMAQLNHIIIPAHDKNASAKFLSGILGVKPDAQWGPFIPVRTANGVTLDFVDSKDVRTQHYAFLVDDKEFDSGLAKLKKDGIKIFASPHKDGPGEINHRDGGRGVYFEDPNGHLLEMITRAYGSGDRG